MQQRHTNGEILWPSDGHEHCTFGTWPCGGTVWRCFWPDTGKANRMLSPRSLPTWLLSAGWQLHSMPEKTVSSNTELVRKVVQKYVERIRHYYHYHNHHPCFHHVIKLWRKNSPWDSLGLWCIGWLMYRLSSLVSCWCLQKKNTQYSNILIRIRILRQKSKLEVQTYWIFKATGE